MKISRSKISNVSKKYFNMIKKRRKKKDAGKVSMGQVVKSMYEVAEDVDIQAEKTELGVASINDFSYKINDDEYIRNCRENCKEC